ncbi:MAG TPA: ScpA family protein [Alphaproteobacteria bacterium]|jgi:segregation and condensation protein A|nr:ScpA family protein [Alphaproteobacteria bacterium]
MLDTDAAEFPVSEVTPVQLTLDLDGFEGPIDVLLALAREQKVDLSKISILALADQYLSYIADVRKVRLEIAADYLVMAAWLAYLKSRLLLPEPPGEAEPSADAMASALQFQLRRLEAMQDAGVRLMARPLLGRDVFARGAPEGVKVIVEESLEPNLYELLKAYGSIRGKDDGAVLEIAASELYSMEVAMVRLKEMLGGIPEWTDITALLPKDLRDTLITRSALAATFAASLELVREGLAQLRQTAAFAPIYLRQARGDATAAPESADKTEQAQ